MEAIPENVTVHRQCFQEVKPSNIAMCCKTLQAVVIFSCLAFYAIGATCVGLAVYHLVYMKLLYAILNTGDQMLKCFVDALAGYTIGFSIPCQTAMFSYRSKQPINAALNLITFFGMMFALAALLISSKIHIWALVTFCFIGMAFAQLFLFNVSDLHTKYVFLRQGNNYWVIMEEGIRKKEDII